MSDNLGQLDQSGTNAQWVKAYLGPTIGWVMLPVMPEQLVTSAAALVIQPWTSRVILKAAVTAITLPNVSAWVTSPFQAVQSAFDRSLWIKDLLGNFQANPCTVTPAAGQTIDNQANVQIINNHALVRLYALTDLSGWYVG